jgi:hypothetical protein
MPRAARGGESYLRKMSHTSRSARAIGEPGQAAPTRSGNDNAGHRLLEKVQPKAPAHSNSDPWELGAECLEHLQRARAAVGANLGARVEGRFGPRRRWFKPTNRGEPGPELRVEPVPGPCRLKARERSPHQISITPDRPLGEPPGYAGDRVAVRMSESG